MSAFPCGECGGPTVYQRYSGGREYWCTCQTTGEYPEDGERLPRATLLRTPEGTAELREQLAAHRTQQRKQR